MAAGARDEDELDELLLERDDDELEDDDLEDDELDEDELLEDELDELEDDDELDEDDDELEDELDEDELLGLGEDEDGVALLDGLLGLVGDSPAQAESSPTPARAIPPERTFRNTRRSSRWTSCGFDDWSDIRLTSGMEVRR